TTLFRSKAQMSILVIVVGRLAALGVGRQDYAVGQQIRQRVNGVGDQRLRMCKHPDDDLQQGEQQIRGDTDQGGSASCSMTYGVEPVLHYETRMPGCAPGHGSRM